MNPEPKELKIVLVGHTNVGKTCIVRQATTGTFSEDSAPTLGASYISKLTSVNGTDVRLQIWDTAGQERYRGMTPMYYRGAHVALMVYSISDAESFDSIDAWLTSLKENADPDILLFLVANKIDLDGERTIQRDQGANKASSIGARFYEVSAKTGQSIEELFIDIPKIFLEKEAPTLPKKLNIEENTKKTSGKGCC